MLADERALSAGEMTMCGAAGVGTKDAITETAATAAATVGVIARSRGRRPGRSTRGSESPRNCSSLGLIGDGAWLDGVSASESGTRLSQTGVGLASLVALAAA